MDAIDQSIDTLLVLPLTVITSHPCQLGVVDRTEPMLVGWMIRAEGQTKSVHLFFEGPHAQRNAACIVLSTTD